ncbi:phosphotransferase, partial [Sulfurimonas sp. SAG-AH-194-L11]
YRLTKSTQTLIVMDSSLELDSLSPFLDVTQRLLNAGVKAPHILEQNEKDGYLVLEDFGNVPLLDILECSNFKRHYKSAIDEILKMQNADTKTLPLYDKEFLHFEMDLMQKWYLEKKLSLTLSAEEKELIANTLNTISNIVLEQPRDVFVHRDFHSRNIMLTAKDEMGVIDYQDAMSGAITYDLVSLLKDCYIKFDRVDIEALALYFRDTKKLALSDALFLKWFDFMGLQRHIKVLGVFSRLHLRDKKDGYLKDIPLVLEYTIETALRYDETQEFALFLQSITR